MSIDAHAPDPADVAADALEAAQSDLYRGGQSSFVLDPSPARVGTWDRDPDKGCADAPFPVFYADGAAADRNAPALALCDSCPLRIRSQCLREALTERRSRDYGVWGATTEDDRLVLRRFLGEGASLDEIVRLDEPRALVAMLRRRYRAEAAERAA